MKLTYVVILLSLSSFCFSQTKSDTLVLQYFLDDSNLSSFVEEELCDVDSLFTGNWIWYIESKNCPDYCYESESLQLHIAGDSLNWKKNGGEFISTKMIRLHEKDVYFQNYIVYQYYCGDTKYQLFVVGRNGDYFLLEMFRSRKIFKSRMKLETRFILKKQ